MHHIRKITFLRPLEPADTFVTHIKEIEPRQSRERNYNSSSYQGSSLRYGSSKYVGSNCRIYSPPHIYVVTRASCHDCEARQDATVFTKTKTTHRSAQESIMYAITRPNLNLRVHTYLDAQKGVETAMRLPIKWNQSAWYRAPVAPNSKRFDGHSVPMSVEYIDEMNLCTAFWCTTNPPFRHN